jgi:hypothetical protein
MAAFQKFNQFVEDVGKKVHNLNADTLKIVLSNSAPVATNTVLANITQIANGNGYTTGGTAITTVAYAQTSGTAKLTGDDVVFTASGGTVGPLRYAVIYNDTPTSPADPLIGWWDYGSSVTLNSGDTFTVDLDQAAGILTIA